jgi:hypothetical protein
MKRPDNAPDVAQRGVTTPDSTRRGDKPDVTGVANEENTLVVETPSGGDNEPPQVTSPHATLAAVGLLQTEMSHVDSPIESLPSTSDTPAHASVQCVDMTQSTSTIDNEVFTPSCIHIKWYHCMCACSGHSNSSLNGTIIHRVYKCSTRARSIESAFETVPLHEY